MVKNFIRYLDKLQPHRAILWQLVAQQLILRYRRTALGYLWTLINPLLMMSVMVVVFATLFKVGLKDFTVFLFAGMIPWSFFSSVVTQSGNAFINNEGLIKKIYLPKAIFPLSIALALLIDNILLFFSLSVIIAIIGDHLTWSVLFIPIAYMALFFFTLGLGLIMSVATVFFRDLQHVILIAMQGLFFLTPIIYKHDALAGGKLAWLVGLNPVVPFIELFRAPLYQASLPSSSIILQAVVLSSISMGIGLFVFLRQEKKIVFRL